MKKNINAIFLVSILSFFFLSCNPQVDFGEQYKKKVYIVNSNNIVHGQELFLGQENHQFTLSVYCSGSENIKEDLKITFDIDKEALDTYNERMMIESLKYKKIDFLPQDRFSFDNPTVTIKTNEQYGLLKLPIAVEGLDPDKRYAVPVRIISNSAGYEINKERDFIILEAILQNGFSGEYSGFSENLLSGKKYAISPALKAMSPYSVRMPIHNLPYEEDELMKTNFMLLTIDSDSSSVHISPWENARITDLGGSKYDKKEKSFDLHYSFISSDGTELRINEKIKNNAIIENETDEI